MLHEPIIFSGVVLDKDGFAVPQASIYFISAPQDMPDISSLTDNEGRFILSVPVEGKYIIGVSADRFESKEIEINVVKNKKLNITIEL